MIIIEPLFLIGSEQCYINCFFVDREKCQSFECVEVSEIRCTVVYCQYQVFGADTVFSGNVDARFVGRDHTGSQRSWIFFETDILRPFMYIQEMTDAVACPV